MDPSHSVRSASPSETSTSSLSGIASLSAFGSSSATSSVYGDNSTTPNRASLSSRNSLTMSQRSRSPKKPVRRSTQTKLTDLDRKRICEYRDANPKVKQDAIGEMFGVERSTISKILKAREKWMAIISPEIDEDAKPWPPLIPSATAFSTLLAAPSLPSSPTKASVSPGHRGRFPELEQALLNWARNEMEIVGSSFVFSDDLIVTMGRELAGEFEESLNFKASVGWLEKFKLRAGIRDGKFVEFEDASPSREHRTGRLREGQEEHGEGRDEGEELDDSDGDFVQETVASRKAARRKTERVRRPPLLSSSTGPSRRHSDLPLSSTAMANAVQMDLDSRNSERDSSCGDDIESTPTHTSSRYGSVPMSASSSRSRTVDPYANYSPQALLAMQQQRNQNKLVISTGSQTPPIRSSPSHSSLAPLTLPTYAPSPDNPSFFPYSFSAAPSPFAQDNSYPLQSPFQPGAFSQAQYSAAPTQSSTPTASGANSPSYLDQHHGRSNSTASSNSAFSGLTTFSQPSNGSGTPLTASSSYSQYSAAVSSLPCTPAPGYFSHGDGRQSQLQLAFASDLPAPVGSWVVPASTLAQSQPVSFAPRRATISGGAPVLQRSSTMVTRAKTVSELPNPVAFEVALASLQNALEYLSTEGNGYVSPMDLIVLSDLTGKMKEHQKAQSPPPPHQVLSSSQSQQASFMTPSLSMSSLPARGLQMQRTNSSGSTMHSRRALRTAHSSFGSLDYTQSLLE